MTDTTTKRRPRILLLAPAPIWPPVSGGIQRSELLYRALSKIGDTDLALILNELEKSLCADEQLREMERRHQLKTILPRIDRMQTQPWKSLRRVFPKRAVHIACSQMDPRWRLYRSNQHNKKMAKELVEKGQYDLIVARYAMPLAQSGLMGQRPTILDVDDVDTQTYVSRFRSPDTPWLQRPLLLGHLASIRPAFRRITTSCDHLFIAKESDRHLVQGASISVLPNIPYVESEQQEVVPLPQQEGSKRLLFVGNLGYRPNRLGLTKFLTAAWPKVKSAVPEAELEIVGIRARPEDEAKWSESKGVLVTGRVEDLKAVYGQCAATISPIFSGGGTNIKVLESLAYGRVAIVSTKARLGYESTLLHKHGIRVAEDLRGLADECIEVLNSPDSRRMEAELGRQTVLETYSFNAFARAVKQAVDHVLPHSATLCEELSA